MLDPPEATVVTAYVVSSTDSASYAEDTASIIASPCRMFSTSLFLEVLQVFNKSDRNVMQTLNSNEMLEDRLVGCSFTKMNEYCRFFIAIDNIVEDMLAAVYLIMKNI